jgi:mutator family transposase
VALLTDGIEFAGQTLVVALGIEENGSKHVLGLWKGGTENATVYKALLEDLLERGLKPERRYLVVLDGSKTLRAAIDPMFRARKSVAALPAPQDPQRAGLFASAAAKRPGWKAGATKAPAKGMRRTEEARGER